MVPREPRDEETGQKNSFLQSCGCPKNKPTETKRCVGKASLYSRKNKVGQFPGVEIGAGKKEVVSINNGGASGKIGKIGLWVYQRHPELQSPSEKGLGPSWANKLVGNCMRMLIQRIFEQWRAKDKVSLAEPQDVAHKGSGVLHRRWNPEGKNWRKK